MEVMGENDFAFVKALIVAGDEDVSSAKWAKTLEDIAEWEPIRSDTDKLNTREGFNSEEERTRQIIRSRVRLRYGLTERVSSSITGEYEGSCSVPVEFRW